MAITIWCDCLFVLEVLKSKINQSREIANQINEVKRRMDQTKHDLNHIAQERENLGRV